MPRNILTSVLVFVLLLLPHGMYAQAQEVGPALGTWELSGKDRREWKAVLVISKRDGAGYAGFLKWRALGGEPAGGSEQFKGVFNSSTKVITLKGMDMKDKKGSIASGSIYEATVTQDGRALRNGTWFGPNVAPGTWFANWVNGEMPEP